MIEQQLIPYQAIREIPARSVLALAAHPDDEVFGCGGTLARHAAAGILVHVVIATDGGFCAEAADRSALVAMREAESCTAAAVLGVPAPEFWRIPDRGLRYGEALVERIVAAIRTADADLVFAPSPHEVHPDHSALAMAAIEAVRRIGVGVRLALYEIGVPLRPNTLVDIGDLLEHKRAAMHCFVSQLTRQRYDEQIEALNRYRAYTLPPEIFAAEAFELVTAEDIARDNLSVFASEYRRRNSLGFATIGASDLPLVSIIIRSMDRPTLQEALDSVAVQTYPNIEVVVVNARGSGHGSLPENCGDFPLRMVGDTVPLARSRAANIGLESARGSYINFLDDDDWFLPDHIDSLVSLFLRNPKKVAIYSRTICVNANKQPIGQEFGQPYDKIRLLAGNYLPIHSVLFSSRIIKAGCHFDESFDLYEDWDFWQQACRCGDMLFLDNPSALYRIAESSGQGIRPQELDAISATKTLLQKWQNLWHIDDVFGIMARIREHELALNHAISEHSLHVKQLGNSLNTVQGECVALRGERDALRGERDALRGERDALRGERDTLRGERDALISSRSWRATAPLRSLMKTVRGASQLAVASARIVRNQGGLLATAHKLLRIAQREGIGGVYRRLVALRIGHSQLMVSNHDYGTWIRDYDTMTNEDRSGIRNAIQSMERHPLISIVMPTYNTNPRWLSSAIDSVLRQIYPFWELCISDDASTDPEVRKLLESYARRDERIKFLVRATNGHISAASNSALSMTSGAWVALLDHDDMLAEHALFWVACTINHDPDVALIYSDEDKIDGEGRRSNPYFKCDWNYDLFLSHNLITHLGVYRKDILQKIGGFRTEFDGAQDYDLALRFIEQIEPEQISHIPRILYHWRMHRESTAQSSQAKPYAMLAGERALNEHLSRIGAHGTASLIGHGFRIKYELPSPPPLVSLIIPTRNGLRLIKQCVSSILELTSYTNYEILIIDNASDDPATLDYFEELTKYPRVRVLRDERPFNYSALNNFAVEHANGEIIGLLNNDLQVISPDWLTELVSHALRPDVGAVGARLWYPNDTVQHGGVILGIGGWAGHAHKGFPKGSLGYAGRLSLVSEFSAVTGACLITRKSLYLQLGGLNEDELKIACNDVDYCLRLRAAGYRIVWSPFADLYHHESATRGFEDTPEKRDRFSREVAYMKAHWGDLMDCDPFYSPNLTLSHEDFSLAYPPRVSGFPIH